ncbi:MAG: HEAT repeat domain-containing protein, partial [Bacillota bacterium]
TAGRLVAPAVGEAIACAPEVLGDFAGALLPALEEPYLQAGAAWAFGRIGQVRPDLVRDAVPSLQVLLASPDPAVREHAAWALDQILAPPQPVTPPPARSPTP